MIVVLLTAAMIFYGAHNAKKLKHISYEIQTKNATLDGLRIVLIADSHLGAANNFENNLENIVKMINDLNPDVVCFVGDIFDDDFNAIRNPERAVILLSNIKTKYGVFACLGNHDGGRTFEQKKNFLKKSNITLLNDEHVIIDERFAIFGRFNTSAFEGFGGALGKLKRRDISDVIAPIGANMPIIVMEHTPSYIKEYGNEVDLILCGHTHAGQMFPGNIITKFMFPVAYGHYQKDTQSPHVVVTSGVSTVGIPARIGTSNEVVSILLRGGYSESSDKPSNVCSNAANLSKSLSNSLS
jgi:hypothetical protein